MRVKIREVISHEGKVDTSKLTPWQQLSVSFRKRFSESKRAQRNRERQQEEEFRQKVMREERLKSECLDHLYSQLLRCEGIKRIYEKTGIVPLNGKVSCEVVYLVVDRAEEDVLMEVLRHKDFSIFTIKVHNCDSDMVRSFQKIPILLEARQKV